MTKLLKILLPLTAAAALTGCVGGGGEPMNAVTTATVMGNINTLMTTTMAQSNSVPALPGGLTAAGGVGTQIDCETESGDLTDADGDGIAVNKKASFSCSNFNGGANTYTRKGTFTIQDLNDAVDGVAGGIKVLFDGVMFGEKQNSNGNTTSYGYDGYWLYKQSGNSLVSEAEMNGSYETHNDTYDVDYDFYYTWNTKFTPDDTNNVYNAGTVEFDVTYKMSGKLSIEDAVTSEHRPYEGSWQIRVYSSKLVYKDTGTCSKFYESGSYFLDDGGGNTLEMRFACSSVKFYVNGTQRDDLYTP